MAHPTSPPAGGMTYIGPKGIKEAVLQQVQQSEATSELYTIGAITIGFAVILLILVLVIQMIKKPAHRRNDRRQSETVDSEPESEVENLNLESESIIDPEKERAWCEDLDKIVEEIEEDEEFEEQMYAYYRNQYKQLGYSDEEVDEFFREFFPRRE